MSLYNAKGYCRTAWNTHQAKVISFCNDLNLVTVLTFTVNVDSIGDLFVEKVNISQIYRFRCKLYWTKLISSALYDLHCIDASYNPLHKPNHLPNKSINTVEINVSYMDAATLSLTFWHWGFESRTIKKAYPNVGTEMSTYGWSHFFLNSDLINTIFNMRNWSNSS